MRIVFSSILYLQLVAPQLGSKCLYKPNVDGFAVHPLGWYNNKQRKTAIRGSSRSLSLTEVNHVARPRQSKRTSALFKMSSR